MHSTEWALRACLCCLLLINKAETLSEAKTECRYENNTICAEDGASEPTIDEIDGQIYKSPVEPNTDEGFETSSSNGVTNVEFRKIIQPYDRLSILIPVHYSIHEPPPLIDGKPVPIQFSVSLKNIPELNELKQMLSIEMNLRIYWQDIRLKNGIEALFENEAGRNVHNYLSFTSEILPKIWVPDIYTDYAKQVTSQEILRRPMSIRLYPNGTIRYSARIMTELSCPMDFKMYPGDIQRCDLRLESYGYTRKELEFAWKSEGRVVNIDHRLAHFDFEVAQVGEKGEVNFASGSYPAIYLCLKFHRRLSYHLLQTYVPSSLFVIISWLSFLIPVEYATGRLAICMTLLLTLTAMFGAVRGMTPSVSYIKALDIWMVGCILFVFLALAEFAFVLRLDKIMKLINDYQKNLSPEVSSSSWDTIEEQEKKPKRQGWIENEENSEQATEQGVNGQSKYVHKRSRIPVAPDSLVMFRKRLEFISAALSPIIFIVFNLIYWPWLLHTISPNSIC
ncbi:glutamate-gated chloride channel alpha-like isoform X1 [Ischnura elegans]|uniref:glutamate-gated chloride channel alpha-like isoform X1 n=1 Tax=Ischnura elegans TaxID=197161 RepID=UPI001ED8B817|nr:glutamate-gated chloride channel alpha-like isoform X1 [Ischnura elegans]